MTGDIWRVLTAARTWEQVGQQAIQHIWLAGAALIIGTLVAVPAGIFLTRRPRLAGPVMSAVGLFQTVPSISFLALAVPLLGIGSLPAIVALAIYALLPILRNTYAGLRSVDPGAVEAGRGMGMTRRQLLYMVELPLALPVIMNGLRTSTVYIIGWATLGAYIGAGGLGDMIVTGLALMSGGHILAGAVPVTLMALLADAGLGRLERRLTERRQTTAVTTGVGS